MPRVLSNIISPVPSDIDVAQAIAPLPIAEIAQSIGLGPDDYDMHGKYKGKARIRATVSRSAPECCHAAAKQNRTEVVGTLPVGVMGVL